MELVSVRLNNGVCMPVLGVSTVLKNRLSLDTDHLAAAYAAGFRHFHLQSGLPADGFREWLASLQVDRADLFISLQIAVRDTRRISVRSSVTQDIYRLGCEHIDLLIVDVNHVQLKSLTDSLVIKYNDEPPASKIAKSLDSAREENLVRAVGLNCHDVEKYEQILNSCRIPLQVLQMNHCEAVSTDAFSRIRTYCKYKKLCEIASINYRQKSSIQPNYSSVIAKTATKCKKTKEQVLLRSYLEQNIGSIISLADYSSLKSAFKIFDFRLSDEDYSLIKQAAG